MRGRRAATLVGAASTAVLLTGCGTTAPALPAASVTAAPTAAFVTTEAATTTPSTPPAAFTGLWPVKDLAGAIRLQHEVEQHGRQPWLLEPESVAAAYAASQLDMESSVLVQADGATVVLREPSTGRVVTITEVQPVKKGPGGIWVVIASR